MASTQPGTGPLSQKASRKEQTQVSHSKLAMTSRVTSSVTSRSSVSNREKKKKHHNTGSSSSSSSVGHLSSSSTVKQISQHHPYPSSPQQQQLLPPIPSTTPSHNRSQAQDTTSKKPSPHGNGSAPSTIKEHSMTPKEGNVSTPSLALIPKPRTSVTSSPPPPPSARHPVPYRTRIPTEFPALASTATDRKVPASMKGTTLHRDINTTMMVPSTIKGTTLQRDMNTTMMKGTALQRDSATTMTMTVQANNASSSFRAQHPGTRFPTLSLTTAPSPIPTSTQAGAVVTALNRDLRSSSRYHDASKDKPSMRTDSYRLALHSASQRPATTAPASQRSMLTRPEDVLMAERQLKIETLAPRQREVQQGWAHSMIERIGSCPEGWRWQRRPGGYQCERGGHGVTDALLAEGKGGVVAFKGARNWCDSGDWDGIYYPCSSEEGKGEGGGVRFRRVIK